MSLWNLNPIDDPLVRSRMGHLTANGMVRSVCSNKTLPIRNSYNQLISLLNWPFTDGTLLEDL